MSIKRIEPGARMSGAVVHGNTVYLAGQVGEGETVTDQCKDALAEVDRQTPSANGTDYALKTNLVLRESTALISGGSTTAEKRQRTT